MLLVVHSICKIAKLFLCYNFFNTEDLMEVSIIGLKLYR